MRLEGLALVAPAAVAAPVLQVVLALAAAWYFAT